MEEDWDDPDFVFNAVRRDFKSFERASTALRRDQDFVRRVLLEDARAFEYAADEVRSDRDF
eukprot:1777697-Prorocentrum_lima.AAC.1